MSSSRWTPRWVLRKIRLDEGEFEVCYDEVTGLYVCPLCSPECKREVDKIPEETSYFLNEKDLVYHIKVHPRKPWNRRTQRRKIPEEIERDNEEDENEDDS
ncbi:hypothetical protein HS7_18450 [Sulfolobales archaeon HS-7]|nr:hypothetical protein HS7_18450 [Sulfolobales archaeon HS-7]